MNECLEMLLPPKQMSFLTISMKEKFFKTKDTRMGTMVVSYEGLE